MEGARTGALSAYDTVDQSLPKNLLPLMLLNRFRDSSS
jgi:hypothetical protein